ncbi:hypothetical protein K1719_014933 [Acacia pycnantha]|nr:hypothetical protein K1719_014933 [Acacia pycnantha]
MWNTRYAIPKSPPLLTASTCLVYLTCSQNLRFYSHSQRQSANKTYGFDNVADALASFNTMIDLRPPPPILEFDKILGAIWENVHQLLNDMLMKNINPDVYTFNILLDVLCKQGSFVEVQELFDGMVNRGLVPDIQNYNVLINGYCNIDKINEAMSLLKEMRHKNLVPSIVTYNSLVRGLCKLGRMSDAQELLVEMHDRGQPADVVTYNILLDTFCKTVQHIDKAIALFHQLIIQGIWPDLDEVLNYDWRKGGRLSWPETKIGGGILKTVEEIFQNLLIKGCCPNVKTYTIMISGLCRDGLLDEAVSLLSKMEGNDCLPDVVTFSTIISALLKNNEIAVFFSVQYLLSLSNLPPSTFWHGLSLLFPVFIRGLIDIQTVGDRIIVIQVGSYCLCPDLHHSKNVDSCLLVLLTSN